MKNRILATLMILALLATFCVATAFAAPPEGMGPPPEGGEMMGPPPADAPAAEAPAGEVTWADYQAYLIATIGAGAPDKAELEAQVGALNSWADVDPSVSPFDMFFGTGTFAGMVMTWDEFVAAGGQGGAALDIAPQVMDEAAEGAPADMPAPEAPAEVPELIAPAPAGEAIVVSFNIADDVTLAPGEDLVFYISCQPPVDLGADPAVSCSCENAQIVYSDVTLGGPMSYPTAELVTISGIDAPCTVTVWYDSSVADQPPALLFGEEIDAAIAENAAMAASRPEGDMGDPGAAPAEAVPAEPAAPAAAPAAPAAAAPAGAPAGGPGGPVGPATGSDNAVVVLLAVCSAGLCAVYACSKKRA